MRQINKIVIHCSDSDNKKHDDIEVIRDWHVNDNGWNDVGYHYFIKSNGDIQLGRKEETPGAHVRGHNSDSIGVCLHGKNKFTENQFKALYRLTYNLMYEHRLSLTDIYGHYEFDSRKTCPNFNPREILTDHQKLS